MKTPMIIVAAPSGAGKSTFVEKLAKEDPRFFDTITYTTREMRRGEKQGSPYFFISKEEFEAKISSDFFVEWAKVHGNHYGTSREQIDGALAKGLVVIMDVDVQGVRTFKLKYSADKSIFILPPSIAELRARVISRDGRVPPDLDLRMKNAEIEMAQAPEFDYQIVNDNFSESYLKFKKVIEELLGSS